MTFDDQINLMIEKNNLVYDSSQLKAAKYLQKITENIFQSPNKSESKQQVGEREKEPFFSLFSKKIAKINRKKVSKPLVTSQKINKGIYLWGDVGRGKTWLMDMFYSFLLESDFQENIQRVHFHEFMLGIHKQLQVLPNSPDPLKIIAKNMAKQYRIICLDEFHVLDIADAVILHGLLEGLFENNVVMVTTSNRHPDDLYKNGTHRERFLPAIALIKQYCDVFHLNSDTDYRRKNFKYKDVFLMPHEADTDKQLMELFQLYSESTDFSIEAIKILGRDIPIFCHNEKSVWFTFDTLCRGPRSSADYLEIAKKYRVVILSEIPVLHEGEEGPARRFLNLIDAFYDIHVHLILSSSVMIENIYQGDLLQFEFERALSRLYEMRSKDWWKDFAILDNER